MKILYDQQIFSFQDYGGISRYFYELISRIKRTKNKVLVEGRFSNNIFLAKIRTNIIKVLPQFNFPYKNVILFYLNRLYGDKWLNKKRYDLLHVTYYHPYFLSKPNRKPYVVTVYDMIHERFAEDYKNLNNQTSKYKRKTISNANQIIAISENTRKDLVNLYGIPENKITVIYLGNPLENIHPSRVKNLPDRYLLFVGNRLGYKNFTLLVKSIASVFKEDRSIFLVCAGGGEFSVEEKILLVKLKIADRVKQLGFKNDSELAYIYKNALIYILPSLYEGFGMTALEAFSMGCPVVASGTSSIPEVCGKATIYVDPKDANSIRSGIKKVMNDEKLRKSLIKLGNAQVKKFSWNKTIKETLEVYERALKS